MKAGVRIAAISSGPLNSSGKTIAICVVAREGIVEGVLSCRVSIDGTNATAKIISMIRRSRFAEQVKIVALNGIAIAGLNVVDTARASAALGAEFAIMVRHRPRKALLIGALKRLASETGEDVSGRIAMVDAEGRFPVYKACGLFVQSKMKMEESLCRNVFEGLRISHLIARGVSTGESVGRI